MIKNEDKANVFKANGLKPNSIKYSGVSVSVGTQGIREKTEQTVQLGFGEET